ncbi:hypothetical protein [Streptomyces sp. BA2]|uniref:hypothetical protein n=1 Tax=Streptomyces sp. BA2 TaxID=436595 RepID=UPI001F408975|nr:hypothetical protein [Streptomyces sp. BA2]
MQLGIAGDLLDPADDLLADSKATPTQLRFLLTGMTEALRQVCEIEDSRGARLLSPDKDRMCATVTRMRVADRTFRWMRSDDVGAAVRGQFKV